MNLPGFSVRRPVAASMVIMVLIVLGVTALLRLPIDLLPDLTFPMVTVATEYPGVGPEEIENTVTKLVEGAVGQVEGLKRISSTSQRGVSLVSAEFSWGTDMDWAVLNVREKIDQIPDYFWPHEARKPLIVKFNPAQIPVAILTLWGEGTDIHRLKEIADDYLKDRLESVEGIAAVNIFSGSLREILVAVDGEKLAGFGIPLEAVVARLQAENRDVSAGHVREGYRDYLVRSLGAFSSVDEIGGLVIGAAGTEPLHLRDVAAVSDTWGEDLVYGRYNGERAATILLLKQSGTNTVLVSRALWKRVEEIRGTLPAGVRVEKSFDQADYIRRSIENVWKSTWQGGVLAVAVLFLFLRLFRPTLIIAVAIPVSVLVTFFPIYSAGLTLNMMSLGGLALAVGMLVDNAIVVLENIFRRLTEEGEGRHEAAVAGAGEVSGAITASTLTTVMVFVPILFTTGITARLFRELAFTVTFSLLVSLLFALTLVPMLASRLLAGRAAPAAGDAFFIRQRGRYRRLLAAALGRKATVLAAVLAVFAGSMLLVVPLGKEFVPAEFDDMFMVQIRLPRGSRVEATNEAALLLEEAMRGLDEIAAVHAMIGVAQGAAPGVDVLDPEYGFMLVRVTPEVARRKEVEAAIERVRRIAAGIPQFERFSALSLQDITSAGAGAKPLVVRLFGRELGELERLSLEVKDLLEGIEGVHDVEESLTYGNPELHVTFDRERAARLGVGAAELSAALETALKGRTASYFREGGKDVEINVRFPLGDRDSVAEVADLPLAVPGRPPRALGDVARIEEAVGPGKVFRENQRRTAEVSANIRGRDIYGVVQEVKGKMARVPLPEGYFVEYAGTYKDTVEALSSLRWVFLLALLLVFMVMAAQFESLIHPFAIMFTVPFSLIGVVWALFLTGTTISVNSFIGVIILAGIVVNNGIVLVSYTNQLRERGTPVTEALLAAGETRLRPVLMTAASTILGVAPMILVGGSGAELRRPLAIALGGGLLAGTVLTLLVLPLVYALFDGVREYVHRRLAGPRPTV